MSQHEEFTTEDWLNKYYPKKPEAPVNEYYSEDAEGAVETLFAWVLLGIFIFAIFPPLAFVYAGLVIVGYMVKALIRGFKTGFTKEKVWTALVVAFLGLIAFNALTQ